MGNLFPPDLKIHRTFDIKGSWEGRSGKPPFRGQRVTCRHCNAEYRYAAQAAGGAGTICPQRMGGHQPNIVLKDNDLTERLRLSPSRARAVYGQLCRDGRLLESFGATDYSLLLGVHNVEYDCTVQYAAEPKASQMTEQQQEAAIVARREQGWTCRLCTVVNAPLAAACAACGGAVGTSAMPAPVSCPHGEEGGAEGGQGAGADMPQLRGFSNLAFAHKIVGPAM